MENGSAADGGGADQPRGVSPDSMDSDERTGTLNRGNGDATEHLARMETTSPNGNITDNEGGQHRYSGTAVDLDVTPPAYYYGAAPSGAQGAPLEDDHPDESIDLPPREDDDRSRTYHGGGAATTAGLTPPLPTFKDQARSVVRPEELVGRSDSVAAANDVQCLNVVECDTPLPSFKDQVGDAIPSSGQQQRPVHSNLEQAIVPITQAYPMEAVAVLSPAAIQPVSEGSIASYEHIEALLFGMNRSHINVARALELTRSMPGDAVMAGVEAMILDPRVTLLFTAGCKGDESQARIAWQQALRHGLPVQAELGNAWAQWVEGMRQMHCKNHRREAVRWIRKAAEQGHAPAQGTLGRMHRIGFGVIKPNFETAVAWYQKAVEQGNASAQNNLGRMYQRGYGVERKTFRAAYWFQRAADQGHALAQNNLGRMFAVDKDYASALLWFGKSARPEQAYAGAQNNIGRMYEKGHGVPIDYERAVHWYTLAAEQGLALAQTNMGTMALYGRGGLPKSDAVAECWFRKAADQGDAEARHNLGLLHSKRDGAPLPTRLWI